MAEEKKKNDAAGAKNFFIAYPAPPPLSPEGRVLARKFLETTPTKNIGGKREETVPPPKKR